MRRLPFLGSLLLIPVLALMLASTPGCKKDKNGGDDGGNPFEDENGGGPAPAALKPLEAPTDGTLKGTVTYDGDPPMMQLIAQTKKKDPEVCHDMADPFETKQQTWIVNDKKVANVVVCLKPPEGKRFAFTKADVDKWMKEGAIPKKVDLNQPHCAFIPHVLTLFTAFKEGDEMVETGQTFVVHNDAPIKHNTKITGASAKYGNRPSDQSMSANTKVTISINPQPTPLSVSCSIHPWMSGVIWSLDNPYHGVTGMDGAYAIQHVPTGVDIPVYVWHEDPNAVVSSEGMTFTKEKNFHHGTMTFKKGENTLNLKIRAK